MNASIIYKSTVESTVLDELAKKLPVIISEELEVAGGKLAILKPKQISLEFSQANSRDVGADIRIMIFARINDTRSSTEKDSANAVLDKVIKLIATCGKECSVDVRLYLMAIGAAEYVPNI